MADEAKLREYLKKVTVDLAQTRQRLADAEEQRGEPIAIVGMACRFADAADPRAYWSLLREGRSAVREDVPDGRYDLAPHAMHHGVYTRHGAFLPDIAGWDAEFFDCLPREALRMDPHQRLFLELTWEVMEDAGMVPARLAGSRTAVLVGFSDTLQYGRLQGEIEGPELCTDPYAGQGSSPSVVAGRLAYHFDLRGPSMTVDTACSSSLVAVHLAAEALRRGECDLAVAAGGFLAMHPDMYVNACATQMLARDGRTKTFDADADGYVMGEGAGVVMLQRLSDALRSDRRIHAVIRGGAVNQDGRSNGLTAPNRGAQVDVMRRALAAAQVTPADVSYVEAHGSGTALGDSIEISALNDVYGERELPLPVGAVKTNIGHTQAAAGMAGLIKTVLVLAHRTVPANLNLVEPNEAARSVSAIRPVTGAEPLPDPGRPTVAAVSSFGWSGTNAHLVLEAAPETARGPAPGGPYLLPVSAAVEGAVRDRLRSLAAGLRAEGGAPAGGTELADLAYTLQTGRAEFDRRRAVVAVDVADAVSRLVAAADRRPARREKNPPRVALWAVERAGAAGDALRRTEPVFAAAVDRCVEAAERCGVPLRGETRTATPATDELWDFTVAYATAHLLAHRGVAADVVAGTGIGELTAGCLAGVFDLAAAMSVRAGYARLRAAAPAGRVDPADVAALIAAVERRAPAVPVVSTAAGALGERELTDPVAWAARITAPGAGDVPGADLRIVLGVAAADLASTIDEPDVLAALAADPDAEVGHLLEVCGRLWERGVPLDWAGFWQRPARLIDLPGYPFQRQRFWMGPAATGQSPVSAPAAVPAVQGTAGQVPDDQVQLLAQRWTPAGGPGDESPLAGPVVVAGHGATAEALAANLAGVDTTVVAPEAVVAGAVTVVDLSALATEDPVAAVATTAKLLAAYGGTGVTTRVIVVTRGGQRTDGESSVAPAQAAVAALPVVANQEYLHLDCSGVDLDPTSSPPDAAAAITAELRRRTTAVSVAYRGGVRLVPEYAPAAIERSGTAVRSGGTYVVTGGLGELGLTVAEHLVSLGAGTIVLVSRSGLPADPDHPRAVAVARLRARGAEVHAPGVDVTDRAAVRALFASRPVDGVIHAAAEMAPDTFRPLRDLDAATVRRHFAAKVTGAGVLADVVAGLDAPPDWCLLFSSTSAILGGVTFGGYAAANAALDALATGRRGTAVRWISAGWDTWASTLQKLTGGIGATLARHAMSDAAALAALEQLVTQQLPQLVVAAGDLTDRLPRAGGGAVATPAARPSRDRPELPQPYAPPATAAERALAGIWSEVLGIEPVGAKDNFFDLGGTSLLVPQLLGRVREHFGIAIATVALFEAPTVRSFAASLDPATDASADPAGPVGTAASARPVPAPAATTRRPAALAATPSATPPTAVAGDDLDRHIAIIGMSGRFPGASDVAAFWRNVCDGVESITFFTPTELIEAGVDPSVVHDPSYVHARPVLADVAGFDAGFFGLSPRMAALTDPQQRIFLEVCWEALEGAGYVGRDSRERVGVFGGSNLSTYLLGITGSPSLQEVSEAEIIMSNDKDALTTTVSYLLDLRGPSVAVQTFCSTSLVAVHLALRSLREGDCEVAIAGGVSVRVPDRQGHRAIPGGQDSHDGHVRTFDAGASGTMFGDGAGAVVLKRLRDAQRDGDHIHAVIRGSAINNDGALKVGYTAPSVAGQARVVAEAIADAGVTAAEIGYVEAHGTATELGDPIEVAALTRAFGDGPARGSVPIGSVKTNVGHTNHAAGVTGLVKVALALRDGVVPATLHYTEPNPEIDFEASPFYVNTELAAWQEPAGRRRVAGVNSLGLGGTNVHVVVEEPPPTVPVVDEPEQTRRYHVLPVSARGEAAADQAARRLGDHLAARSDLRLADVAYTLQAGRRAFQHRRLAVSATVPDAAAAFTGAPGGTGLTGRLEPVEGRPVAFLLAGVGEQYPGLVRDLYRREPVFRAALDECLALLAPVLPDVDVTDLLTGDRSTGMGLAAMLGRGGASDARGATFERTEIAQPLMFAVDYALATTLSAWGVRPRILLGYSLGEYVAACLAGVLSLEDATALVAYRAALISRAETGMMLAVGLDVDELRGRFRLAQRGLDVAAVNGPGAVVVAGPSDAGQKLAEDLRRAEVACRPLATTHAFHSRMLAGLSEELTAWVAGNVTLNPPRLPYLSNVTGQLADAALVTDPGYWSRHMCGTVQFADAATTLLADEELAVVEIGPGQSLGALLRTAGCPPQRWPLISASLPAGADPRPADQVLAECVGRLWLTGVDIDWEAYHGRGGVIPVYPGGEPGRVPLPTYPFQRQRYWIESTPQPVPRPEAAPEPTTLAEAQQLPRLPEEDWLSVPLWRQTPAPAPSADGTGSWLVYARETDSAVLAELRRRRPQVTVTVVYPGEEYRRTPEHLTIRPEHAADALALLRDLRERDLSPTRVIHLWTRGDPAADDPPAVALGLHSLVAFARAAGEVGLAEWALDVVTCGSQQVLGPAEARPEAALVTGPALVVPLEYPSVTARIIDAELATPAPEVVAELLRPATEPAVALRRGRRWVRGYEPVAPVGLDEASGVLREGGVYLITGGLGGIGLGLAEQLAPHRPGLVLFGRTGLPPAADWDGIVAGTVEVDESVRSRVVRVRHLRSLGAQVEVVVGDVADPRDVRRAVDTARERFGALHGVLHAAGVPGTGLIQFKSPVDSEQVLRPKVDGLRAIIEGLGVGTPAAVVPDFVVLFSSITSATGGGPGQVDYCAANAYLDRGADLLTAAGVRTVSIGWGEWTWNAWDDGLTGFDEQTQAFFRKSRATFGITFEEGWRTLLRALASGETHVVVSTQDLPAVVRFARRFTVDAMASSDPGAGPGTGHPRPELVTPYQEPTGPTEQKIAAVWCRALQLERVGAADNFFELGGNSLLGITVLRTLRAALPEVELPPHVLYEAPSVTALARFVDGAGGGADPSRDREVRLRAQMRRSGLHAAARRGRRASPTAAAEPVLRAPAGSSSQQSTETEMS